VILFVGRMLSICLILWNYSLVYPIWLL
jgi:hypothetical protein